MALKPVVALLFCLFCCVCTIFGQKIYKSKFIVDTTMRDTFAFTRHWAYPVEIWKDGDGFHTLTAEKITPADTVHIFFTANCKDKASENDSVRYCFASKKSATIKLRFADFMPGYYIEHSVYIKGDSFYIKPYISYEVSSGGEKMVYLIQEQQLTLNKKRYNWGDTVIGFIDCKFVEVWSVPSHKTRKTNLYFKGYFCTPLKRKEEYRKQ